MNYYNENDPNAVAWLQELMSYGQIPKGLIDDRSISDVKPSDLAGFTQHHFFAGIGGWSHALALAGWPEDRPVWTGSCPCQPFSAAGAGNGVADERHLWPHWFHLVRECRPATVLGEQVASKAGLGWFDLVSADLEGEGYTARAADLCAAGVNAPHIRQRLYFHAQRVADRYGVLGEQGGAVGGRRVDRSDAFAGAGFGGGGLVGGVADGDGRDTSAERKQRGGEQRQFSENHADGDDRSANANNDFWDAADWLFCRDGKWRPVEPGTFPLAHGVSGRVGLLRGYGNAINTEQAQAFIEGIV